MNKTNQKEQTGIYNVTFNEKKVTPIQINIELIELIEDMLIKSIAMYIKGYHNFKTDKGLGAEHIKLHLDKNSNGFIVIDELLNLGRSLRKYTEIFKEPFIEKNGAKIYEWENQDGARFRTIVDKLKREGHSNTPLFPFDSVIITFYSDRNLNEPMQFKNPLVAEHYEKIAQTNELSIVSQLVLKSNVKFNQEDKKDIKQHQSNKKTKSNDFEM
ncbi:hypothetical protein BKH41_01895 [Helicobacter sp. 12S02232-10]|uniref:hypothetical protein n=1 Tax=Helicobacter sp. 12S02232-10 TaxID=1476197 RepID=UPI000BA6377A|nr:hypothetical protein [Helicobacter sp. 12S02232-10]PAF49442.1 hypothetical protein BKH41_01895 [Helicobacter sp. 12S02232-10]